MDLVERIVAEVMSQLENEPAVSSGANANDSKVIAGRVITADSLAEQAKGQTKIQVQSEALLTPSANDWIRQNKVELVRGDVAQPTADQAPVTSTASVKSTSNNQTLIVVHDGSSVVDAVIEDLDRTSTIDRTETTSAETAASLVIDKITGGANRVVVITEKTHWVACLANRNEQIRAATVNTVVEVNGVRSVMDGNVFAINANGRSFFELRNLVRAVMK
jgi:ribose 5-phosphate isomerase RpiB